MAVTCECDGCDNPVVAMCHCRYHWNRGYGAKYEPLPTPHDRIIVDRWMYATRRIGYLEDRHNDYQRRYATDNERDGYLVDPAYLEAAAQWRGDDAMAAD